MTTRDEIRQFNAKLSEAAARGDAGALAAMYDDEACFVVAGSPTFQGAGQIAPLCDEFLSDGPPRSRSNRAASGNRSVSWSP
jgi:ketosteroid isomerase-like protein